MSTTPTTPQQRGLYLGAGGRKLVANLPERGRQEKVGVPNFEERILDARAMEYLKQVLADGGVLARTLLLEIESCPGRVTAIVPLDLSEEAAYDFGTGGKLPSPDPSQAVPGFRGSHLPNTDRYVETLIESFLEQAVGNACVLEDRLSRPDDPALKKLLGSLLMCGNEVYHLILASQRYLIEPSLRMAKSSILVGAMTRVPEPSRRWSRATEVSREVMSSLAGCGKARCEHVFVSA